MLHGGPYAGPAAHGLADDHRAIQLGRIHHRHEIRLEVSRALLLLRTKRAGEAAMVEDHHAMGGGEHRHLLPPTGGVAAGAVREDQRRAAVAVLFVVDVDVVVAGVGHGLAP